MIFTLNMRMPAGDAVVPSRLEMVSGDETTDGRDALGQLLLASRIVFLIHGYNVDQEEGYASLTNAAAALAAGDRRALVCVLWPGDSTFGAISYPFEHNDADDAASELARYARTYLPTGLPLSFVAHSLGCRVAMGAIKRLTSRGHSIEHVALLAAAIDDDSLAAPKVYATAADASGKVAVLASRQDRVLRFAYPLGDLLQAFVYWSREEAGLALGYNGARPHRRSGSAVPGNVRSRILDDALAVDHGDYLRAQAPNPAHQAVMAYVRAVLNDDVMLPPI